MLLSPTGPRGLEFPENSYPGWLQIRFEGKIRLACTGEGPAHRAKSSQFPGTGTILVPPGTGTILVPPGT
eukprot:1445043-Rhodomonas_salina.1